MRPIQTVATLTRKFACRHSVIFFLRGWTVFLVRSGREERVHHFVASANRKKTLSMSYPYSSLYLESQWAKMKLASLFGQKQAPTDRLVVPWSFRYHANDHSIGTSSMISAVSLFGSSCPLDPARSSGTGPESLRA
jgi:hypothetical protein